MSLMTSHSACTPPIDTAIDTPKKRLQYQSRRHALAREGHGVDHIPNTMSFRQPIIERLQRLVSLFRDCQYGTDE